MKKIKKLLPYLPPLIWMSLIFIASSQHKVGMGGSYWVSFIIFKTIHIIEYGILYTLWRLALKNSNYADQFSILISFFYAISDELHQTLVPTRQGTVRDVIIDLIGILLFSKFFFGIIIKKLTKYKLFNKVYNIS